MRATRLAFLALLAIGGCETSTASPSYDAVMKNYMACVIIHADQFAARSNEDPYYLALAARDACARERLTAQKAVLAAERPSVALRIWRTYDDGIVEDMTARITRKRVN